MGTPPPSKQGLRNSIEIGRDDRIAFVLLVFPALTFVAALLGWPPAAQFFLSVLAIMPLAALIGTATEALADRLGGKTGGLLNATFGNAPDLLVGIFGVQRGLIPLVKATLIGGLISNSALIMGICYVIAGLLFHRPRFKREEAGHHSVLMMLTLAAVLFPSAGSLVLCGQICTSGPKSSTILHVSVGISVVLLLAYISYLVYGIFGLESLSRALPEGREVRAMRKHRDETAPAFWPARFAIGVLAGATALLVPVTDILTSQVQQVTSVLHVGQVFVGLIVVANAGNVAEAYSAIRLTIQRGHLDPRKDDSGLDLALGIASASSIQIATFVAPIVVLYSLTAHSMSLAFSPVEVAILAILVLMFTFIAQDGESNWLEGAQLIALYAMAAVIFYGLPSSVFGASQSEVRPPAILRLTESSLSPNVRQSMGGAEMVAIANHPFGGERGERQNLLVAAPHDGMQRGFT